MKRSISDQIDHTDEAIEVLLKIQRVMQWVGLAAFLYIATTAARGIVAAGYLPW